ncbi:MAG: outer membrane beta-barrel protein [Pseudorhodoplanes sp.]|jgi:outer membrane immunogenic protein|nr:outer membrane beta-barrel protein [Pseudorhodoplanes sp.]
MRRLFGLSLSLLGIAFFAHTANAADLPRKAPPPAPVVAAFNWSGFYAGIHGGWATGDFESSTLGGSADIDGGFFGGQIGWNWQAAGSPWVWGVEVDSAWADIGDSVTTVIAPFTGTASSDLDYFGTARLRVGYAWDRVLWYVTGGLAWAHNEISGSLAGPGFVAGASSDNTHVGWTIGGGVEWAFADPWSVKLEYLFMDFGSEDYFGGPGGGGFDADTQIHTFKIGLNYRWGGYGKSPVVARY